MTAHRARTKVNPANGATFITTADIVGFRILNGWQHASHHQLKTPPKHHQTTADQALQKLKPVTGATFITTADTAASRMQNGFKPAHLQPQQHQCRRLPPLQQPTPQQLLLAR
jgi:hypothetical protein